jgi:hypothetical protein
MGLGFKQKPAPRVDEAPFEMANLHPKRTGLDFVVWISNRAGASHDARIKVSEKANQAPQAVFRVRDGIQFVAGDDSWMSARQKADLEKWVAANRMVLLTFWDSEHWDSQDAIERLKKI